jgi:hypothetical protein
VGMVLGRIDFVIFGFSYSHDGDNTLVGTWRPSCEHESFLLTNS